MPMSAPAFFISFTLALIPPLTSDERVVLSNNTRDDTKLIESSALDILINHIARAWDRTSIQPDDFPSPSIPLILSDPAQFRADPFLITGTLLRIDQNPLGRSDLQIWIIAPDHLDGNNTEESSLKSLVAVLIHTESLNEEIDARLNTRYAIPTRFFARFKVPAADSSEQATIALPFFVGRFPQLVSAAPRDASRPSIMPVPVLAGLILITAIAFIILRLFLRRTNGAQTRHAQFQPYDENESDIAVQNLPEEPAKALEVLHDRAEKDQWKTTDTIRQPDG